MDWQILLFALVATICTTLVGLVWFSRLLFGDIWIREMTGGRQRMRSESLMAVAMVANALLEYMMALIFRACLVFAHLTTASEVFGFGFLIFVGFMLPVLAMDLLWGGKSLRLFAINAGHRVTTLVLLCILGSILQ